MKTQLIAVFAAAGLAACGGSEPAATAEAPAATAAVSTTIAAQPAAPVDAGDGPAAPSADEVRAMIARDGAAAAVRTLSEGPDGEPTRLTAVAARIEAGDEAYLALTPQLLAAASGDMREGLMIGVNRGLTANAAGLLRQTGADLTVADLCRPGAGAGPTEEEPAWTARAISAVEAVQDAVLSQQKAACLAALRGG